MKRKLKAPDLDDEELEAVIDFQRSMIEGAAESGETEEVKWRKTRLAALIKMRMKP